MPARLAARATFDVSASAARNAGIQTLGAGSAPARVAAPGAGMSLLIGQRSTVGGKAAAPPDSHYRDVPDMCQNSVAMSSTSAKQVIGRLTQGEGRSEERRVGKECRYGWALWE